MLEVAVAERVMHHPSGALGVLRRRADDVHHGHMLGVTAGDRVGRRQLADPERGHQRRHAAQAAVTVRGITGVEFIGAADPADPGMGKDVIEELQLVIAGHAEYLGNPKLSQPVQQVITNGVPSVGQDIHQRIMERGGICLRRFARQWPIVVHCVFLGAGLTSCGPSARSQFPSALGHPSVGRTPDDQHPCPAGYPP